MSRLSEQDARTGGWIQAGAAGPIPSLTGAIRGSSAREALLTASLATLGRPELWAVALSGFLVRGGIVLLALPILILPSPIQLAASFGLDAVSISGEPTARFVQEVVLALILVAVWLILSTLAGAAVDVHVIREIAGSGESEPGSGAELGLEPEVAAAPASEPPGPAEPFESPWLGMTTGRVEGVQSPSEAPLPAETHGSVATGTGVRTALLWRLLVARLVTLLPLIVAFAWAARRLIDVGYQEVTVPSDTATPLVLRIALGAADALAVIVVVWLVTELVLASVTRVFVLADGRQAWPTRPAIAALLRRPLPVLAGFVIGMAVSVLVIGATIVASSIAWEWVQYLLRGGDGLEALVAVMALVLVWLVSLALAGILSAWRSALLTAAYVWATQAQDPKAS